MKEDPKNTLHKAPATTAVAPSLNPLLQVESLCRLCRDWLQSRGVAVADVSRYRRGRLRSRVLLSGEGRPLVQVIGWQQAGDGGGRLAVYAWMGHEGAASLRRHLLGVSSLMPGGVSFFTTGAGGCRRVDEG